MRDIRSIKNINIHKNNPMPIGKFKQRSNATLVLDLYDEHMNYVDLANQEVSIRIERPDTVTFEQIDGITKVDNILTIKLKNEVLEVCGKCRVELNLKDSTGQMTSADFYFEVGKTVLNDEIVFSSDSYESLEKALVLFQKESQAMMDEFDANEKVRINNENTRKTNETNRVNAETDRVRVESLRVQTENTRVSNENTRKSQETTRQNQESIRQQQEANRQNVFSTNETNRQNTFNTSERDRTSTFNTTQTDKQNTFNQSEASRNTTFTRNEETRQANETTRISSENSRVDAENTRKSNETGRVSAETDRTTKFNKMQTDGNKLIGDMQTVVDSNIGAEVVEARKGKAKLNDRLDEIENHVPVWQDHIGTNGNLTINDGFEDTLKNLVIKGKTVGGYNSETGQSDTIVSSGEAEGNKIPIKSVGKNLLDVNKKENQTIGTLIYTDGTIYDSPNRDYYYTSWIKCEKATKYTVSGLNSKVRIVSYDSNKNFKSGGEYGTVSVVKGDYIRVGYIIAYMNNVMLEESTLATEYVPYVEDKKEVTLTMDSGLKGIRSVQDELKYSESKIIQKIGKRAYKVGDEDDINVLTDKTNTLYILDTPIIHNLSQTTTPLKQYKGTTHIIQENEVVGNVSCKAKISLSAQSNRLRVENEKLIENAKITELDQEVQNEKITTTMLANTELFEMMMGLMPMTMDNEDDKGGVSKMVEVYVTLIIQGDKTLDQVPTIIRPKVEAKLRLLGIIE